jgi:hypothetical protein
MVPFVNRKAADERGGDQAITGKFPGHVGRKLSRVDAIAGERVISKDRAFAHARHQNKGSGAPAPEVLISLLPEIAVECAIATREAIALVSVAKRLDDPCWVWHLPRRSSLETAGRLAKTPGRRRGIEKGVEKHLAVEATERQDLAFADGARCDLLSAAQDKIRQRPAREIGRVLE